MDIQGELSLLLKERNAEIERLRAERDLWRNRAERMFWLLPDDVKIGQFADKQQIEKDGK